MTVRIPRNKFEDPEIEPSHQWVVAGIWCTCGLFCVATWALAIYGVWRLVKG